MDTVSSNVDAAVALAMRSPAADRVRLIERLAGSLFSEWVARRDEPARSLLGMCADLGPAPSAGEIDSARQEMWGVVPRGDL